MEWIQSLSKAIAYMENNLTGEIGVEYTPQVGISNGYSTWLRE